MEELRTLLFYLLSLIGLIVATVIFAGQTEVAMTELPTTTPTGPDTAPPTETGQSDCVPSAMSITSVYIPDSPFTTTLAPPNIKGERLTVSGIVYASDGLTPLPGALLEVWQTDVDGHYERLRARMQTDADGYYQFITVKPGHYRIDCELMPAHIHYRVSYLDNPPLFTLLFFEGDLYLADIPSVNPTLIRPLTTQVGPAGPVLHATFDIVLPVHVDGE